MLSLIVAIIYLLMTWLKAVTLFINVRADYQRKYKNIGFWRGSKNKVLQFV